ncbi:FxsA family protein [Crenobacter cavernae]|uniref:Membrane protein FxsA n=1 Tax=Crenobacter cavernae TaxID=2290923 RepID=A0ABY0FH92_9NEIS|nr:FxsA family protein [Crenobacter cavernae]RXZ44569.1 membrane protein FxsA [Crenobacter cavernae]
MRGLLWLILLYPLAEIVSLIMLTDKFGGGPVLLWLVVSGLLGVALLRNQKLAMLLSAGALLRSGGEVSLYSLLWPVRTLLAGVLLIIPGPISDLIALLLLLPLKGPSVRMPNRPPAAGPDDVIDGEFRRVDDPADPGRRLH